MASVQLEVRQLAAMQFALVDDGWSRTHMPSLWTEQWVSERADAPAAATRAVADGGAALPAHRVCTPAAFEVAKASWKRTIELLGACGASGGRGMCRMADWWGEGGDAPPLVDAHHAWLQVRDVKGVLDGEGGPWAHVGSACPTLDARRGVTVFSPARAAPEAGRAAGAGGEALGARADALAFISQSQSPRTGGGERFCYDYDRDELDARHAINCLLRTERTLRVALASDWPIPSGADVPSPAAAAFTPEQPLCKNAVVRNRCKSCYDSDSGSEDEEPTREISRDLKPAEIVGVDDEVDDGWWGGRATAAVATVLFTGSLLLRHASRMRAFLQRHARALPCMHALARRGRVAFFNCSEDDALLFQAERAEARCRALEKSLGEALARIAALEAMWTTGGA